MLSNSQHIRQSAACKNGRSVTAVRCTCPKIAFTLPDLTKFSFQNRIRDLNFTGLYLETNPQCPDRASVARIVRQATISATHLISIFINSPLPTRSGRIIFSKFVSRRRYFGHDVVVFVFRKALIPLMDFRNLFAETAGSRIVLEIIICSAECN